jgi:hypothetical protein
VVISATTPAGTAGTALPADTAPPGWLIDTRPDTADSLATTRAPAPLHLKLSWSGPAEFTAGYRLESSDDLKAWRAAGSGQLLSLSSASGALTQPLVALPWDSGRFVRLWWSEAAGAPKLTDVQVQPAAAAASIAEPATTLTLSPSPASAKADVGTAPPIDFDLGAAMPLTQIELQLPNGNWVAPVVVQGRVKDSDPWTELARTVIYRLERGDRADVSPPLALASTTRYVRLITDDRVSALDPAATRLVAQVRLARLVFAAQGTPPFSLQAGNAMATSVALPVSTLVPDLDRERARLGSAKVGLWREVPGVADLRRSAALMARLRPLLLWAVLLLGVAGLGFMAWRLARPKTVA